MWKRTRRMLPHAVIVIANMYIVFFLIDRVNTAMNFIDNPLTKGLLLVMSALAVFNAFTAPRAFRWRTVFGHNARSETPGAARRSKTGRAESNRGTGASHSATGTARSQRSRR